MLSVIASDPWEKAAKRKNKKTCLFVIYKIINKPEVASPTAAVSSAAHCMGPETGLERDSLQNQKVSWLNTMLLFSDFFLDYGTGCHSIFISYFSVFKDAALYLVQFLYLP